MRTLTERLAEEERDDRPDLTPLIDVVFMLLLFFVLTTTFAEDTFFPLEMPEAERATIRTPKDAVVVEVSAGGELALDRAFMRSRRALFEALEARVRAGGVKTLVLKADRRAAYEDVAWVVDAARALEIGEISLAVRESE